MRIFMYGCCAQACRRHRWSTCHIWATSVAYDAKRRRKRYLVNVPHVTQRDFVSLQELSRISRVAATMPSFRNCYTRHARNERSMVDLCRHK